MRNKFTKFWRSIFNKSNSKRKNNGNTQADLSSSITDVIATKVGNVEAKVLFSNKRTTKFEDNDENPGEGPSNSKSDTFQNENTLDAGLGAYHSDDDDIDEDLEENQQMFMKLGDKVVMKHMPDFDKFKEYIREGTELPDDLSYKNLRQYCNGRSMKLKSRAGAAKTRHQVYTILGSFPFLKSQLRSRGWIEKLTKPKEEALFARLVVGTKMDDKKFEILALSQLVSDRTPDFIWIPQYLTNYDKHDSTYSNRMKRTTFGDFTTKCGLCYIVEHSRPIPGLDNDQIILNNIPRSYILAKEKHRKKFIRDYHVVKCLGFINYLYRLGDINDRFTMSSDTDSVSAEIINFAINEIRLSIDANDLLANTNETYDNIENYRKIYSNFDLVMHHRVKLRLLNRSKSIHSFEHEIREVMMRFSGKFPHVIRDGIMNVWILKPNVENRGRGILLHNTEQKILQLQTQYPEQNYIVQKYVEKPFLVYKTKFDIRLFLLTVFDGTRFSIWMYKNCYFKFCSQEFSLNNFHESIHLTNHAVQRNYTINEKRNKKLPTNNMWLLTEFFKYLRLRNHNNTDVWHKTIYPSIVKVIVMIIYSSISETHMDKNSFELFGADFILNEDLVPKLLEINASPDLHGSTSVSKAVCDAMQEDLLRGEFSLNIANRSVIPCLISSSYNRC